MNSGESKDGSPADPWSSRSAHPDRLWRSAASDIRESGTGYSDDITPILSIAWNIRRIFVVLLTCMVIATIFLIVTLYVAVEDDPSETAVIGAIILSVLVAVAGVWYAINSKRLSK